MKIRLNILTAAIAVFVSLFFQSSTSIAATACKDPSAVDREISATPARYDFRICLTIPAATKEANLLPLLPVGPGVVPPGNMDKDAHPNFDVVVCAVGVQIEYRIDITPRVLEADRCAALYNTPSLAFINQKAQGTAEVFVRLAGQH